MKVSIGQLLKGGKLFTSNGIEKWFYHPRFRVVGIHPDKEIMFLETLGPKGKILGYEYMNINSGQWQKFIGHPIFTHIALGVNPSTQGGGL